MRILDTLHTPLLPDTEQVKSTSVDDVDALKLGSSVPKGMAGLTPASGTSVVSVTQVSSGILLMGAKAVSIAQGKKETKKSKEKSPGAPAEGPDHPLLPRARNMLWLLIATNSAAC